MEKGAMCESLCSEESKAYKLYEHVEGKIIIDRDVLFEETKCWN